MNEPIRFSERKLLSLRDDPPWSLEDLVAAQRMECDLTPYEKIAEALGRTVPDVMDKLRPPEGNRVVRQERANVGFARLKGR